MRSEPCADRTRHEALQSTADEYDQGSELSDRAELSRGAPVCSHLTVCSHLIVRSHLMTLPITSHHLLAIVPACRQLPSWLGDASPLGRRGSTALISKGALLVCVMHVGGAGDGQVLHHQRTMGVQRDLGSGITPIYSQIAPIVHSHTLTPTSAYRITHCLRLADWVPIWHCIQKHGTVFRSSRGYPLAPFSR